MIQLKVCQVYVVLSGAVLRFFSCFFVADAPPRNYTRKQNSREIFPTTSLEGSGFFEKNVYEPNFAHCSGDFQLAILLTVLMNLPKK